MKYVFIILIRVMYACFGVRKNFRGRRFMLYEEIVAAFNYYFANMCMEKNWFRGFKKRKKDDDVSYGSVSYF